MAINGGEINVLRTHPNLYWFLMFLSFGGIALAVNFFIFNPTFSIWGRPHELWGAIFLVSSFARLIALNVFRRLQWVRLTMFISVAYMAFLAIGTSQPAFEGNGSLQLPIVYALVVAIQVPLLFEPFINPKTAK